MLLINKQSPWVLHLFNQMTVSQETISQCDSFCLISKATHLPDQSNIKKYNFKQLHFGFLKFITSLDCYSYPLSCDIILVNNLLLHLTFT